MLSIYLITIDIIIKYIIMNINNYSISYSILTFGIIKSWNSGISFGLFTDINWTYINIIILLIFFIYIRNKIMLYHIFILSGGIANIIDRFRFNAVFDYIYISIYEYDFPIFNFADILISIGVLLYLVENILNIYKCKNDNKY